MHLLIPLLLQVEGDTIQFTLLTPEQAALLLPHLGPPRAAGPPGAGPEIPAQRVDELRMTPSQN